MPIDVPGFLKANAQRGLDYNREGKGGDGLTDKTLDEAREFAQGFTTESKLRRMPAWFARHKPDLDAPKNKPGNDDFPGAGAVAWLIWGGSVSGDVMDAADWAAKQIEKLDNDAKAFDHKCINKMATEITSSTPEEMVAQLTASLGAAQAEHSELKKAFEALAAEKMATTEAIKLEAAEATKKLADAEAIIATLTGEKESLAKQLAEAQANQITASKEAAKVVASLGVKPVANSPAADAQAEALDHKQIVATFLAMKPGADRQAFFNKHKGIIAPGF